METSQIIHWIAIIIGSWIVGAGIFLLVAILLPSDFALPAKDRSRTEVLVGNLVGWPLIVIGAILLPTPLNGIVLVLVGVALADVPRKHQLLVAILRREGVRSRLNGLRRRFGRAEIEMLESELTKG